MSGNYVDKVTGTLEAGLDRRLEQVDRDLSIMDRHDDLLRDVDQAVLVNMRKTDREVRDAHLHSIPRARKHQGTGQKNAP